MSKEGSIALKKIKIITDKCSIMAKSKNFNYNQFYQNK
jgi:hypothetical protein